MGKTKRLENGRFPKGVSGNPKGGSKPRVPGLKEFRDQHSMEVMEFLLDFMHDESRQDGPRVNAARELNDRMHGRAPQAQLNMNVDGSGNVGDLSGLSALLQAAQEAQAEKSALILRAEFNEAKIKEARAVALSIEPEPDELPHDTKALP